LVTFRPNYQNVYPKIDDFLNFSDRGIDAETAKQHTPDKLFSITMTMQEIK
jgi:hypothetical protein